ncbi:uncharacterized protein GGS22DRAFT_80021 [Annulohypoxylon maeteangense]|uniref:uncharacterized protein n=1 Tax=Annulohypoxylon maeteangense TaxID=1927788 RepID=UPI002007CDA6|nr:uncharacterized protein GGS22DRAFT_80021 [Annulohypoxylon maeteangense]KAI0880776.1 hypothetical protein GGS22DRAFT_80021 [Annulohypoxylon maeteangense]
MPNPKPSPAKEGGNEVLLRQRYNDPIKLKKVLDEMFGEGKYGVQTRSTRWILRLPEAMPKEKLAKIEETIRSHYNG